MARAKKEPAGITPEFKDNVSNMNADQKKLSVFNMQAEASRTRSFLKDDPNVQAAKDAYDLVAGPANDTLKVLKNRTSYIIDDMKDAGEI